MQQDQHPDDALDAGWAPTVGQRASVEQAVTDLLTLWTVDDGEPWVRRLRQRNVRRGWPEVAAALDAMAAAVGFPQS